ncbi:MAG: outer membrane lipoprotein-sorting protein [Pseudomonadota bacterium]
MKIFCTLLFAGTSFLFFPTDLAHASSEKAQNIISSGEKQMRGNSSQSTMRMVIKRPTYERELLLRAWAVGLEKAVVEILKPAKEEGVVSLRLEQNMWNYLPKTDQVVRVPSSLMLQSWMGSDFTNDDLMKASSLSRDYTHTILKNEMIRGENTVLIECLPRPNAPVVWGKVLYWARTEDNLPVRQRFYDDKGKLVRTLDFSAFKKMDDRIIPTELRIEKADGTQEATTVTYEKTLFDREIPSRIFSQNEIKDISQRGKVASFGWFTERLN